MKLLKLFVLTTTVVAMTACSGGLTGVKSTPHGYINIQADASGMEAFSHLQNSLVTNGKMSEESLPTSPAWAISKEKERTKQMFYKNKFGRKNWFHRPDNQNQTQY